MEKNLTKELIISNIVADGNGKVQNMKVDILDSYVTQHICSNLLINVSQISKTIKTCTWQKPSTRAWACYGGLIRYADGATLLAYVGTSDRMHVIWLELYNLYHGILLAIDLGFLKLGATMDSKFSINIFNLKCECPGRYWVSQLRSRAFYINLRNFRFGTVGGRRTNQLISWLHGIQVLRRCSSTPLIFLLCLKILLVMMLTSVYTNDYNFLFGLI